MSTPAAPLVVRSVEPEAILASIGSAYDEVVIADSLLQSTQPGGHDLLLSAGASVDDAREARDAVLCTSTRRVYVDLRQQPGRDVLRLLNEGTGFVPTLLGDLPVLQVVTDSEDALDLATIERLAPAFGVETNRTSVDAVRHRLASRKVAVGELTEQRRELRRRLAATRRELRMARAQRDRAVQRRRDLEGSRAFKLSARMTGAAAAARRSRPALAIAVLAALLLIAGAVALVAWAGWLGVGALLALALAVNAVLVIAALRALRRAPSSGSHGIQPVHKAVKQAAREGKRQHRQLQRLATAQEELATTLGQVHAAAEDARHSLHTLERRVLHQESRRPLEAADALSQQQAMLNLFHTIPVTGAIPTMGGWAASPDLVVAILEELRTRQPAVVVECGSGVSSLWLGLAIHHYGLPTKVIALEHDDRFGAKTTETLVAHGVDDVVEVRHAPLAPLQIDGFDGLWYDLERVGQLAEIGLLLVDGPPAATGAQARFPALPALRHAFAEKVSVVLDDMIRDDEQEVARRWESDLDGFSRVDLRLQKGATIFRRG